MISRSPSQNAIHKAIAEGQDLEALNIAAREPSTLASRDAAGVSVILAALYRDREPLARRLAALGAPVGLHEAAALGNSQVLRGRLDKGNLDSFTPDGFTPLHLACYFGREDAAVDLIESGANINTTSRGQLRTTALLAAIASHHPTLAFRLLDLGARTDARGDGGFTPLHAAAARGDSDLVVRLLDLDADARAVTDGGLTPADSGEKSGHSTAARLLRAALKERPADE